MNHVTTFTLLKYLRSQLPDDEARRVEQHLSNCDFCTSELADLNQLEKQLAARVPDGLIQTLKQSSRPKSKAPQQNISPTKIVGSKNLHRWAQYKSWKVQFAAGLLILLIVGSLLIWVRPVEQPVAEFRSAKVENSLLAIEPEEGGIVRQMPIHFRWTSIDQAVRYRVIMYHQKGTQIMTEVTQAPYIITTDTLQLEPGITYLWQIDALNLQNRILVTDLFYFQFQPEINE